MIVGLYLFHQFPDNNFCMLQIHGMGNVHVLSVTIAAGTVMGFRDDIGIFAGKPCGDGIGRGSDDDPDIVSGRSL